MTTPERVAQAIAQASDFDLSYVLCKEYAQAAIAAIPDAARIAELEEALEYIARADGKSGGEFIDWQRCVDRIQGIARAALQGARTGASASAPVDTASAPPPRTDRG